MSDLRLAISLAAVAALVTAAACGVVDDPAGPPHAPDGKADDPWATPCDDPRHGDGACDLDLACAAPDVDCFVRFADDAAAATWFAGFEADLAAEQLRPPRRTLPSSDPRFARLRALLDRGWAAYVQVRPVGALAPQAPALVLVEDPAVNAFVLGEPDGGRAVLAVMVQTGLADQIDAEAALLGLVMHELEHAVGLHVVAGGPDRLRRWYLAAGGEPLGLEQPDDPVAREHGAAWRALAAEAGPHPGAELGPLPYRGGEIRALLDRVIAQETARGAAPCAGAFADLGAVKDDIDATASPLDGSLRLDDPALPGRIAAAMARLRDECLAGLDRGFVDVLAEMNGVTPEAAREQIGPEDLALVEGVHLVDAVANLLLDRRARMRELEAGLAAATGQPWPALRFFSFEEAADDATVPVLAAMDLPADALGSFLLETMDGPGRAACAAALDAGGAPPYGVDLADEHHASCWRVHHVGALADRERRQPGSAAALHRPPHTSGARAAAGPGRPGSLPAPRRLSDLVLY